MKLSPSRHLVLLAFLLVLGCVANTPSTSSVVVLQYEDFGPQAMAWELIGNQWWQWNTHGASLPTKYDIKVVVYKGKSKKEIAEIYPINREKQQDYRYLEYSQAREYLNDRIRENAIPSVTERLNDTKRKLEAELGSK